MGQLIGYDVRIQMQGGARVTVRVAALDAQEAREQALYYGRPGDEVVSARRSQYAIGVGHRRARRDWVATR